MLNVSWSSLNATSIKFEFNPSTPVTYNVKSKLFKSLDQKGVRITKEERVLESEVSITKHIERGFGQSNIPPTYTFYNKTQLFNIIQDGKPVKNPLLDIVAKVISETKTDHEGNIIDISGLDAFDTRVKDSYPPQISEGLLRGMNSGLMETTLRKEWGEKIGHFSGKEFSIGDTWTSIQKVTLPSNDPAIYYSEILFSDWVVTQNVKCVRIMMYQHSDADYLGALVSDPKRNDPEAVAETDILVSGSIERWVDPTTMLIYFEKSKRKIIFPMTLPENVLVQATLIDRSESLFYY